MSQISYRQMPEFIRKNIAFSGSSVSSITTCYAPGTGRLPAEWAEMLAADVEAARANGEYVYVVLSYSTPIGWTRPDGTSIVPDVTYSHTTSKGQALCRAYLPAVQPNRSDVLRRVDVEVRQALGWPDRVKAGTSSVIAEWVDECAKWSGSWGAVDTSPAVAAAVTHNTRTSSRTPRALVAA